MTDYIIEALIRTSIIITILSIVILIISKFVTKYIGYRWRKIAWLIMLVCAIIPWGINPISLSEKTTQLYSQEERKINDVENYSQSKKNIEDNKQKEHNQVVFIDEIYEILKLDNSVKDDINYLLEVGSTMGIYLVVSTDSVLEDDTYDLFNKDNVSKISFYLTSRGEYNLFLGKAIRDNLGKDGMYLDNDKNLIRMSIPMVEDDEIERVCKYIKDNK